MESIDFNQEATSDNNDQKILPKIEVINDILVPTPRVEVSNDISIPSPLTVHVDNKQPFMNGGEIVTAILSIFALVIGVVNIAYTSISNTRARTRALHDEFWIQKVIFPKVIDPLYSFFDSIIADLSSVLNQDESSVLSFLEKFQIEISKMFDLVLLLKVVSPDLYVTFNDFLTKLEDDVSLFLINVIDSTDRSDLYNSHSDNLSLINNFKISMLMTIRDHQNKLC